MKYQKVIMHLTFWHIIKNGMCKMLNFAEFPFE
jgi:hypothetical protein